MISVKNNFVKEKNPGLDQIKAVLFIQARRDLRKYRPGYRQIDKQKDIRQLDSQKERKKDRQIDI